LSYYRICLLNYGRVTPGIATTLIYATILPLVNAVVLTAARQTPSFAAVKLYAPV